MWKKKKKKKIKKKANTKREDGDIKTQRMISTVQLCPVGIIK